MDKPPSFNVHNYVLFIDSNICYDTRFSLDLFTNRLLRNLISFRDDYNKTNRGGQIEIVMPQLVFEECVFQKKEAFLFHKSEIAGKLKKLGGQTYAEFLKETANPEEAIRENGRKFLKDNHIEIINHCSKDYFDKILEKAIQKNPPFTQKLVEGHIRGDAGFKDCVIWYSVVEYAKNPPGVTFNKRFLLLTNNTEDFKPEGPLVGEFKKETNRSLRIIEVNPQLEKLGKVLFEDAEKISLSYVTVGYLPRGKSRIPRYASLGFDIANGSVEIQYEIPWAREAYSEETFETQVEDEIKSLLAAKIVQTTDFNFEEVTVQEVKISLEYYKWFYRIIDITLQYSDGEEDELIDEPFFDTDFVLVTDDDDGTLVSSVKSYLEGLGYSLDEAEISYSIDQVVEDE